MEKVHRAAVGWGLGVTVWLVYLLTTAYRSFPLVNYVLQNGVPVLYYGEAMVVLISATVGLCVSLVVLCLGSASSRSTRNRKGYERRLLGYGCVGFLTLVVPALMMDPAALSVGLGVVIVWRMLASRSEDTGMKDAVYEKEPIAQSSLP